MRKLFVITSFFFLAASLSAEVTFTPYNKAASYIGNGKPVMLELGTRTCVGCKKMNKILEPFIKAHPRYQIFDVLINENKKTTKNTMDLLGAHSEKTLEEKLKLNGYPYQIFYDGSGREIYRHGGVLSAQQLETICKKAGF